MITILSEPTSVEPVYTIDGSNLAFVLDSNDSANYAFRYVQKISINGADITTTKVVPNIEAGEGKGVMQPGRILEDFLSYDLHRSFTGQLCPNSYLYYEIQFGEYSDGTLDGSSLAFETTWGPTFGAYAWNAAKQYDDVYTFEDYLVGDPLVSIGRFLTRAPITLDINLTESQTLSILQDATVNVTLTIIVYEGLTASTYYIPQPYGFTAGDTTEYAVSSWACGPADLNLAVTEGLVWIPGSVQATDPIIDCNTTKYEVKFTDYVIIP